MNKSIFLISDCSSLVDRNGIDFWVLIFFFLYWSLYPETLLTHSLVLGAFCEMFEIVHVQDHVSVEKGFSSST